MKDYAETTVPNYDGDQFKRFFRLSPATFETICASLSEKRELVADHSHGGNKPLSLDKQLMITLWYLSHKDTIISISDRFGVSEYSVLKSCKKIMNAILKYLTPNIITWPSEEDQREIASSFEDKTGFHGIIGAVDGTHIEIRAPHENPNDYINRKGYHSVVLQVVCREDRRFTNCFVGWPGSVHDSRVLRNSDLVNEDRFFNDPEKHIIGDGAYPLKRWLMTTFRDNGHLTPQQRHFNTQLSKSRQVIERAIGLLKGRFSRLKYIDVKSLTKINKIVMAACTLHNICITQNDDEDGFIIFEQDDLGANVAQPHPENAGVVKRNAIMARLQNIR